MKFHSKSLIFFPQIPREKCHKVPVKVPKQVPREECKDVPSQQCEQVPQKVPKQVPRKVPRKECKCPFTLRRRNHVISDPWQFDYF